MLNRSHRTVSGPLVACWLQICPAHGILSALVIAFMQRARRQKLSSEFKLVVRGDLKRLKPIRVKMRCLSELWSPLLELVLSRYACIFTICGAPISEDMYDWCQNCGVGCITDKTETFHNIHRCVEQRTIIWRLREWEGRSDNHRSTRTGEEKCGRS